MSDWNCQTEITQFSWSSGLCEAWGGEGNKEQKGMCIMGSLR